MIHNRLLPHFLKVFFNLLYNQFAWAYDLVAALVSLGRWKTWVTSTLPYLKGPRVLEVGHGPGHLQAALSELGVWTCGVDVSFRMGLVALGNLCVGGYVPVLVNGYAQYLPFPNEHFHQVVATFPSDFIFQPETLTELRRILVPGGHLLVLPVAWITGYSFFERLAAWLFRVTGQSQYLHEAFTTPFLQAGFDLQIERKQLNSSVVLLLHARKAVK